MVGGIGAWWPGRREEDIPMSEIEARYTRNFFRKKVSERGAVSTTCGTAQRDAKLEQDW